MDIRDFMIASDASISLSPEAERELDYLVS
jgi:hypothetical protein